LDAAHGHEHNEDGSEMTRSQREKSSEHHSDPHLQRHGGLVLFLSASTVVLLVLLIVSSIKHKRAGHHSQP
ncbi:MAG: hypothetical protein ACPHYF_10755, partial [Akkermansiaceae bacterium]